MKASVIKVNANFFKVLGHARRLEIVVLLQGHSLTVNQIVQMTALRQSAVSQHLITLKSMDIVITEKLGKEIYYTLNKEIVEKASILLENLSKARPIEDAEPTVTDPICRMHLTPNTASYTSEYDGVRHYFCGKGCLKEFNFSHKGVK